VFATLDDSDIDLFNALPARISQNLSGARDER
jgi:hypothetical protein